MFFIDKVLAASAREGEGAGRGPGGLRHSERGPLPHPLKKENVKLGEKSKPKKMPSFKTL